MRFTWNTDAIADALTALQAAPEDQERRLVFGDLLLEQGHPWGALFGLPDDDARTAAAQAAGLLGGLRPAVRWSNGFADEARLTLSDGDGAAQVRALLALPLARLLQRLVLVFEPRVEGDAAPWAGLPAALTDAPPTLTALACRASARGRTERLALDALAAALPRLTALEAVGLHGIERVALPALRRLELHLSARDRLAPLRAADLPALEQLVLWRVGDEVEALGRAPWPSLRTLALRNHTLSASALDQLLRTPLIGQLRELDLSDGGLRDVAVAVLLRNRAAIAHLDVLNLSGNHLSRKALARLTGLRGLRAGRQRPVPEERRTERYGSSWE